MVGTEKLKRSRFMRIAAGISISLVSVVAVLIVSVYVAFYTPINPDEIYKETKALHSDRTLIGFTFQECEDAIGRRGFNTCSRVQDDVWCFYAGKSAGFLGTDYYSLHIYNEDGIATKTEIVNEVPRGG